jgi:polar amino acid transport system substrate-binding protein
MKVLRVAALVCVMVLLVSISVVGQPAAGTSVLERTARTRILRVGVAQTEPGAYFNPKTKDWEGINIDLARILADQMGVELEIVETSWDLFIVALDSDKFDVFIPGAFYTAKRAMQVQFTTPVYYKGVSAMVRKDDNRFGSLDDLNKPGVTIAVRLGAVEDDLAGKLFPNATITRFKTDTASTIGEAVRNKQADVWVADAVLQEQYSKQQTWGKVVGDVFGKTPLSWVIKYGDHNWASFLNIFIEWLRSSGQLEATIVKYGQSASTVYGYR